MQLFDSCNVNGHGLTGAQIDNAKKNAGTIFACSIAHNTNDNPAFLSHTAAKLLYKYSFYMSENKRYEVKMWRTDLILILTGRDILRSRETFAEKINFL